MAAPPEQRTTTMTTTATTTGSGGADMFYTASYTRTYRDSNGFHYLLQPLEKIPKISSMVITRGPCITSRCQHPRKRERNTGTRAWTAWTFLSQVFYLQGAVGKVNDLVLFFG